MISNIQGAGTLLLTRGEVSRSLDLDECIRAVENAFRLHGEGRALGPASLGVPAEAGGFHVKAGGLPLSRPYFAAKVNGNFFENARRFGMPNIQGLIVLCDAENGYPLALMDSIEITIARTGAATAVAAKHLARQDSRVATICGCGNQGAVQLRVLARSFGLEQAYAFDREPESARRFAQAMSRELGFPVEAVSEPGPPALRSDICVTCTPSRRYFLERSMVSPGTFIAAVGADSPEKQEIDPEILASSTVVADVLEQCSQIGEIHHALEAGTISAASVHAELSEVVSGKKPGRTRREEITVFDSTGTALQDVAAAAVVFEKALAEGLGTRFDFFSTLPSQGALQ